MIEQLKFSTNWNKKLNCRCFSTIRKSNRFKVGDQLTVLLHDEKKGNVFADDGKCYIDYGVATVVHISPFKLSSLTDGMALIDTGYTRLEVLTILNAMYGKGKPLPPDTTFYFIILKYNGVTIPPVEAINDSSFNYKE